MRSTIFIYTTIFMLLATGTMYAQTSNVLAGTWVPVRQETGGTKLPKAAIDKQKLIITDSTYTVIAESVDKGIVRYNRDKMDIYGKEGVNAGKHFTAIFKYDGNEFTICYNLAGDSYPVSYETKDKPMFFLSVFKKETK